MSKKRKLGLDFPEYDDSDSETEGQSLVDNINYEFRSYRKDPVLDEDLDPLGYWKINRFKYPNLIKLVKKYFYVFQQQALNQKERFQILTICSQKEVCV